MTAVLGLREALALTLQVLRDLEWTGRPAEPGDLHECPDCGSANLTTKQHAPGCKLDAAIRSAKAALAAHDRIAERTAGFEPPAADTITVGDVAGLRRTT